MKKCKQQLKKNGTSILFFVLSLFALENALAAQPEAYTIIANPGEDAGKEMRISWHTDMGVEGCFVEYTKKVDTNWEKARKVPGQYEVSTTWDGIDTRIGTNRFTQDIKLYKYGAVLDNLEPNTDYMYRVGLNSLSETRYFKTAGTAEFSFAWISDYHHYDPIPSRMTNAMNMISTLISTNNGVDFILSTGDDVAYGGSHSYWKDLFAHNHYRDYMWVNMNGNHDNMDMTDTKNTHAFFRDTHNTPRNGYAGQEGVSYWFRYGNILWIILNTEDLNNAAQIPKAQEWAAEVIRKNPSQYIFVAQHYQWFSGKTGAYGGSGFTRWNAFFDKWGVDLALGGNEHIYVRTNSLYKEKVSTQPGKGTVYIQAPSSDGDRGAAMNPSLSSNEEKIACRWTEGTSTVGGSLVTVNENGIKIGLYDRNGVRQDYAEIPANRPAVNLMPPVINYVEPNNQDAVKIGIPMEVTFSGKMDKTSVENAISFSPEATVSYAWINDYTISIDISQLKYATGYTMTIDGNVARNAETGKLLDGANNGTEGSNFVLNFTTMEQDLIIPAVISYDPQGDQQDFLRPVVRLEFNKLLDENYITPHQITVKDENGKSINGTLSYIGVNEKSVLHYIFTSDLTPNQVYKVTLAPGIRCLSGNKMSDEFSFTFSARPRKTEKSIILQPFTSLTGWSNGAQTGGHVSVSTEMDKNVLPTAGSQGSLRMNYQWKENTEETRRWRYNNGTSSASLQSFSRTEYNTVQFYLFGDGSHTKFTVVLQRVDASVENTFYGKFIEMDWIGWKKITWDLSDDTGLFYPLLGGSGALPEIDPMCVKCLYVEPAPDQYLKFEPGSFWVSQVEALQLSGYADIIVTFNSMGGSTVSPIYLAGGDKITPPADPVLEGYIFNGWYKNEECTEAWDYDTDVVTGNITLYAKWKVLEIPANYPDPLQDPGVTAQDSYTFNQQGTILDASWLNESNIKRAIHRDEKLYVLTQGVQPKILIVNPATLEIIKELDQTGIADGIVTISDIAFTSDNYLLACNKQNISITDGVRYFKVYLWENDDAVPQLYFQLTSAAINANWNEGTVGETMAVSGPSWESTIYVPSVTTSTSKQIRIVGISKKKDKVPTTKYMMNTTEYTEALWGTDYQFMVSPGGDDCFIITSNSKAPTEYQFDMSKPNRDPMVSKGTFTENGGYDLFKTNGANYFRYAGHSYMAAPVAQSGRVSASVVLFDITNGLNNAVKLSDPFPGTGLGIIPATYMTAYGTVDNTDITLGLLAENQGFATFKASNIIVSVPQVLQPDMRVYPNPIGDIVHIDSGVEIESIKLIDLTGRVIRNIPAGQTSFDMSDIKAGNYILLINKTPIKVIKK